MSRCEGCGYENDVDSPTDTVLLRSNGKLLCLGCEQNRVREMSPSGLIRNEERIAYGLYEHYLGCGLDQNVAFERLASALALDAAMLTRMLPVLDELGKQNNRR